MYESIHYQKMDCLTNVSSISTSPHVAYIIKFNLNIHFSVALFQLYKESNVSVFFLTKISRTNRIEGTNILFISCPENWGFFLYWKFLWGAAQFRCSSESYTNREKDETVNLISFMVRAWAYRLLTEVRNQLDYFD